MRISDWSSDVCSSDLICPLAVPDFERFYSADFPAGTPISKVCCVYRFRHVRIPGPDLCSLRLSAPSVESAFYIPQTPRRQSVSILREMLKVDVDDNGETIPVRKVPGGRSISGEKAYRLVWVRIDQVSRMLGTDILRS